MPTADTNKSKYLGTKHPEKVLKWTIRVECLVLHDHPQIIAFVLSNVITGDFMLPKRKILEGRTNLSECLFEALFNDS